MRHPFITAALCAVGISCVAPAAAADAISNASLRVEVAEADGALVVTDLRTKREWRQAVVEKKPAFRQKLATVDAARREIVLDCDLAGAGTDGRPAAAPARIVLRLHETRPEVEATFTFSKPEGWRQAAYPYVFARDGERVANLFPHGEGMLVPVRKTDPDWLALPAPGYYGGTHAYCMCLGIVDEASGEGLLTLLPDIGDTDLRWADVPLDGQTVVAPQLICKASLGTFTRPWRMTFCFHDAGGYVAMAKRYRQFFAEMGLHKTLRQKAAENPAVSNLAGTTVFWAVGRRPRDARDTADLLKSYGIDRCLLAMCNIPWRKPDEPAYQEEMGEAITHIRSLGFEVYRYDQYRDAFEPDPKKPHSHQINTEAWPDKLARRKDGSVIAAFGPGSGVVCPKFFMPLAKARLDQEFAEFAYSGWFLDCLGSCGFGEGECHNPSHPTDRYECRREREALLAEVNRRGKLAATECGIDYLLPYIHWAEGGTTLVRWSEAFHNQEGVEHADINSSSEQGKNEASPLAALEKLPPTAKADRTVSIDTRFRIPFYSLCHHDEVVQTWRWEDGMNHPPVYWPLKNLWSVLYGGAPMYRISGDRVKHHAEEIRRTQQYVNEWVRQIAFDEMIDHRFVTVDREVQETEFSSGRGVVVNFSDEPHTLPDGQVVKARDYVSFTKATDGRRTYTPPPCPNVFAE
ncbi:MAG: hypothetical protein NTW36_13140 [Planctomycetia bacterium]|nr:hypothetical protein [Planctomycetia bacterium]